MLTVVESRRPIRSAIIPNTYAPTGRIASVAVSVHVSVGPSGAFQIRLSASPTLGDACPSSRSSGVGNEKSRCGDESHAMRPVARSALMRT